MDQVSRPMLIALAATIALAAVWLVALGHTSGEVAGTPAAPARAVAKAGQASAAAPAQAASAKAAAAKAAAKAPAKAAAKPAAPAKAAAPHISAANTRDAAVVRDLRDGKVVVMLFWNAKAADDVATEDAVRALNRHGGRVAVHVVPISRVGEYESITRGVTINQTPTTLVIDRNRRTRPIVGLTERGELTQAVDDALAGRG
jgi:cytoskeletal protein RodZ